MEPTTRSGMDLQGVEKEGDFTGGPAGRQTAAGRRPRAPDGKALPAASPRSHGALLHPGIAGGVIGAAVWRAPAGHVILPDAVETRLFRVDPKSFRREELEEPAAILRSGGLVAFPTETVYGLGANAHDPDAVHRLRLVKDRPPEKPFTLHLASAEDVHRYVEEVPRVARLLMERYWPGPLTIVFPGNAGQGIGVRVPANDIACELIRQVGAALVAPSANPARKDPATDAAQAMEYFGGRIDAVVDGGPAVIRQASAVVEVDATGYRLLREGIITHEMIHQLLVGK
ncbi:MAG: L-threonylcarbamoyladenylate synthase, partial [Thermoanaerobaculia bacterium]